MSPTPADGAEGAALNAALVDGLKAQGAIRSARVEAAFRAVPRHLFLPDVPLEQVYADTAVPTKHQDGLSISASSQPSLMATMLEALAPAPGARVLEIGAGTGYNAALLAHLVGETGQVVTVDLDEDIVAAARAHLAAAGLARVQVVCGDGALGYPPGAPYDCVELTVAAADLVPAWTAQLAPGGRLLLPLVIRGTQKGVLFVAAGDHLESQALIECAFMLLRGALAGGPVVVPLPTAAGDALAVAGPLPLAAATAAALLAGPHRELAAGLRASLADLWAGAALWLALQEPRACSLMGQGGSAVPILFGRADDWRATLGLVDAARLCVLVRPAALATAAPAGFTPTTPFDLQVRSAGPDDRLAEALIAHLAAWDAAGRPGTAGLRIRAYPPAAAPPAAPGAIAVRLPSAVLVLDWPGPVGHEAGAARGQLHHSS